MSWFLIKSVLNISQTGFVDVEKVKDITLNLGDGMNEHDVDKLMNVGDDDQDGTMSYAEIMNIIEKYNKMQEESAAEQNVIVKKFNSQNDNY